MTKVLVTGMSAAGKSTLIAELARRGYNAVDLDDPRWSEHGIAEYSGEREWLWREDAVRHLLDAHDSSTPFVAGCASNQPSFYARFGHIVLLSAPGAVMLKRLATRTNNPFGKHPEELERILRNKQTVEPMLRRIATLELDGTSPLDNLVRALVGLIDT